MPGVQEVRRAKDEIARYEMAQQERNKVMSMPPTEGGVDRDEARVDARVPLFLLESLQSMDRPTEVMEDEDVAISMPRRFGLNKMVHTHIHKLRADAAARRKVPSADVRHWIQLVIRRPDAEDILENCGARLAETHWRGRPRTTRLFTSLAPGFAKRAVLAREARRMLRSMTGAVTIESSSRPVRVRVAVPLTVQADPGGVACSLYTGALGELASLIAGKAMPARHSLCAAADGADACEWVFGPER